VTPGADGFTGQAALAGAGAARGTGGSTATLASTVTGVVRAAGSPSSSLAGGTATQDAALAGSSTPGDGSLDAQALSSSAPGASLTGASTTGGSLAAAGQDPAQTATLAGATQPPAGETSGQSSASAAAQAATPGSSTANALVTSVPPAAAAGLVSTHSGAPATPAGKSSTPSRASSAPAREAPLTASSPGSAAQAEASSAPAVSAWTSRPGPHRAAGDTNTLGVPDTTRPLAAAGASAGGTGSVADLAQAVTSGEAPTTLASAGQAPLVNYGVGLQQAIETAHSAIQFAARQGLSQARIALQPEELGEIRIYLSQNAEGLVARLTAQTPAAAQALAAGHSELRQSLSSIGISLAHLDIGHLDQSGGTAAEGGGQGGGDHQPGGQTPLGARGTGPATSSELADDPDMGEQPAPQAPELSGGALVDVLV
jgi:flagellar hook-length control protein FliK